MSAKMLFTKTIHVPKALTTLAVSLVLLVAALPAHAQQQDQYRIVWIGHPVVIIVGLILVLLAGIGAGRYLCVASALGDPRLSVL
jgi:hypothetical protein